MIAPFCDYEGYFESYGHIFSLG